MASASKQEDDAARSAAELKIGFADPAEKPWALSELSAHSASSRGLSIAGTQTR